MSKRVWNAQHNGFAFLSFAAAVHNSGNYAFIVSHDFQAEKMAATAAAGALFWWFRVLLDSGPGLG